MAKKVPNFTVSSHKGSRNAFDLSQSHLFQAAPGQLYPILSLDLIPDDVVDINVEDYVKSMPVVSSPLCSARGVYEFFFVPYHQLWHNWDQFITQMFQSTRPRGARLLIRQLPNNQRQSYYILRTWRKA